MSDSIIIYVTSTFSVSCVSAPFVVLFCYSSSLNLQHSDTNEPHSGVPIPVSGVSIPSLLGIFY